LYVRETYARYPCVRKPCDDRLPVNEVPAKIAHVSVSAPAHEACDARVDAPRSGAGEREVEKKEGEEQRGRAVVDGRERRLREVHLEVRQGHLAGEDERHWTRQQAQKNREAAVRLEQPGNSVLRHQVNRAHRLGARREPQDLHRPVADEQEARDDAEDAERTAAPRRGFEDPMHEGLWLSQETGDFKMQKEDQCWGTAALPGGDVQQA